MNNDIINQKKAKENMNEKNKDNILVNENSNTTNYNTMISYKDMSNVLSNIDNNNIKQRILKIRFLKHLIRKNLIYY